MVVFDVDLPCYYGPLDLLLYLVRREELDIESIPLARIAKQYCEFVDSQAVGAGVEGLR
jgi:segregation and condensation protein A